jgi:UDP-GlcNAc:undecaprenyl-phosphate GlcNAc-1-phosphate transferase
MNTPYLIAAIKLAIPWQVVAAGIVSFLSTLLMTPIARWCAHKLGVVDCPDGARKLQRKPIALLGGVAVLSGLSVTVFLAAAAGAMDDSLEAIVLVSVGLSMLCAVGVIDDAYNLRPGWKLLAQIFVSIPMVMAGHGISCIGLFDFQLPLGPIGFLAAMAWLVACTNAVNLIDGMDGLCSTTGLGIAAGVTAIACLSGADNSVVCAAALAGSLAGFLIYNRPPASIYLGDAGSMIIGMTLGLLTMRIATTQDQVTHPVVMAALMAVPLGDVALAMIRRKLSGCRIFQADRGHIHHRLLDHGFAVPQVLAVIAVIGISTGAVAAGAYQAKSDLLGCALLGTIAVVLVKLRIAGHHEWALVRSALARRSLMPAQTSDATEGLPAILRFETEHSSLHTHAANDTSVNSDERRRAA